MFREVNRVADALTKLGCHMQENFVIMDSSPSNVFSYDDPWVIGNGRSIAVTNPNWLPHPPCIIGVVLPMRVCELMDDSTGQWAGIEQNSLLFYPGTRRKIMAVPLNTTTQDVWMENTNRQFSVRTAYQVALRL